MSQTSKQSSKDKLFSLPRNDGLHFQFNETVVNVFPDMIERSIPGYHTILNMIAHISHHYAESNSNAYDLGCSLGAASLSIARGIAMGGKRLKNFNIIAVDSSEAMIKQLKHTLAQAKPPLPVTLRCEDLCLTQIHSASIVVLNFTLQFISIEARQKIIDRIFSNLNPGGILVISEKILYQDPNHQALMTDLYHQFKRTNGYSDLEIAQKREALENVLIPETISTHVERLQKAGFRQIDTWFQCFTFTSLIAIKSDSL